jgi:hypothetical protein
MMKSILDRTFRYTPGVDTDLRKTFLRLRREQRAMNKHLPTDAACVNVVHMVRLAVAK